MTYYRKNWKTQRKKELEQMTKSYITFFVKLNISSIYSTLVYAIDKYNCKLMN